MQKYSLVWIDLEMTGLDVMNDTILEIATIITDDTLNIVATGPNIVIHESDEKLAQMNDWCKKQHGASGLMQQSKDSVVNLQEAQEQTLNFIKEYCKPRVGILCGNSVWQDRIFLQRYMPEITNYLHYRLVDVTSIRELITRWYPNDAGRNVVKKDTHRALEDIQESIEELRQYKDHFFTDM